MLLHSMSFSPSTFPCPRFSSKRHRFSSLPFRGLAFNVSHWSGAIGLRFRSGRNRELTISASSDSDFNVNAGRMRKVVEHICLLKAKQDLSEEDENDMLDYLYTSQYQMRGILATSLGFLGFQVPVGLPFEVCSGVQRLGIPVMDPFSAIRLEFNYGLEFVHLIAFDERVYDMPVEDALGSFKNLTKEFPSLIVQSTQVETFEMFLGSREYKNMWNAKFEKIVKKSLAIHYSVDPVAKEIM